MCDPFSIRDVSIYKKKIIILKKEINLLIKLITSVKAEINSICIKMMCLRSSGGLFVQHA